MRLDEGVDKYTWANMHYAVNTNARRGKVGGVLGMMGNQLQALGFSSANIGRQAWRKVHLVLGCDLVIIVLLN